MIDFYGAATPNAYKVAILLEELGLDYRSHHLDTARGDHRQPAFLALNPNGKLPAIVEAVGVDNSAPLPVWESGAILFHLAERHGRFMPADRTARADVMAWLMWQMSALGPTGGQMSYFGRHCPDRKSVV